MHTPALPLQFDIRENTQAPPKALFSESVPHVHFCHVYPFIMSKSLRARAGAFPVKALDIMLPRSEKLFRSLGGWFASQRRLEELIRPGAYSAAVQKGLHLTCADHVSAHEGYGLNVERVYMQEFSEDAPSTTPVLGVPIVVGTLEGVMAKLNAWLHKPAKTRLVSFTNVHMVVEAHLHPDFKEILRAGPQLP